MLSRHAIPALILLLLLPSTALSAVWGQVVNYGVFSTTTSGDTEYYNEMTQETSTIDEVTNIVLISQTGLVNLAENEQYEFGYQYRIEGCKADVERVSFYTMQNGSIIDRWSDDIDCNTTLYWGWNDYGAIRSNWQMGVPVTFGAEHYGNPLFEFQVTFEDDQPLIPPNGRKQGIDGGFSK